MTQITINFPVQNTRNGKDAYLTGIDLENKKIEITGVDHKITVITFSTAAAYKATESNQNLNPTYLAAIAAHNTKADTTPEVEITPPGTENEELGDDPRFARMSEKTLKSLGFTGPETTQDQISEEEEIPQGCLNTVKPEADNEDLAYIEDLADIVGYTAKVLRKKLRQLEADHKITKAAHTWCWDKASIDWEAIQGLIFEGKRTKA